MIVAKPHEIAGVRCPKETGEMKKEESCTKCPNFVECFAVVLERI